MAVAQNPDAEVLFNEGERFEAAGKIAEACRSFDASNKIEPRAGTMIRLGDCREREGKLASAWTAFKDALTRVTDPKKREYAQHKIAQIEPRMSYLTVLVPELDRVEGLAVTRNGLTIDAIMWGRTSAIDGGTYVISATAPGHETWSQSIEVPVSGGKVEIEVPKLTVVPVKVDATPISIAPPVTEPPPSGSMFTPKRKIAVGLAGAGMIALAAGIAFGIQSGGFEDDAYALCPDPRVGCDDASAAQDLLEQGRSRATLANVSFGAAGLMVIGSAVLWVIGAPEAESGPSVSARVTPQSAGLDVLVRF